MKDPNQLLLERELQQLVELRLVVLLPHRQRSLISSQDPSESTTHLHHLHQHLQELQLQHRQELQQPSHQDLELLEQEQELDMFMRLDRFREGCLKMKH